MSEYTPHQLIDSPLTTLEQHGEFIQRHIGPDEEDVAAMLKTIGEDSLQSLVDNTLPPNIRSEGAMDLPRARNERETLAYLKSVAQKNRVMHNMIGLGYHDTVTPAVIQRNVLENPGWYTAYTPYQAEIAQGRLEALLNFQQMVMDMTAMDIANASLLDEATAAAEAMAMLKRVNRKNKSSVFLVSDQVLPQTLDVLKTRAADIGIELATGEPDSFEGEYFGCLLQYPGQHGQVRDIEPLIAAAHESNALTVVAADLLALALLKPPGEMGADVVVGVAQRFGVPMGYGGPHAAFFATREDYKRTIPGRIIGVSKDRHGRLALRMALQTREQHIRRDKATSNICTAQALLAVMASMYAVYHGAEGIRKIARRIHRQTSLLAAGLSELGLEPDSGHWFDTITLSTDQAGDIYQRAAGAGINLLRISDNRLGISVNEVTGRGHIQALWRAAAPDQDQPDLVALDRALGDQAGVPAELQRQSEFLSHEVFQRYRSETEMLRYMKRLENRDLSLAHAMIPLGSCTMKLNATSEMIPITWPEFADIHPFAPADQVQGYRQLFRELEDMLIACTGYDAVSLQPNAGSQGEYAGLLAIKGWQQARGEGHRDICLIPSSAHGTNPASAVMAGMKVVVVACDDQGNVDVDDLKAKVDKHRDDLAALMVTYPSTHGVYEEAITDICEIIHKAGGQVYLDGANLNALVGCSEPGKFGADVSHLNLHKTFCIPHGGGGPGVGPICVGQHLKPHLPGHDVVDMQGEFAANTAVSAAPWGSAGILPISWAYIAMMGRDGLTRATQVAILNANYIARQLDGAFDVLYTGRNGRVAHECIIDLRPFKESCGIEGEDVAKRLIDYGFHAPTMSWPVPGTLMIEPTESESKAEIDRFIEAMRAIREEIRAIENGEIDATDNPLKNAPHNLQDLVIEAWSHPYSREQAIFPADGLQDGKFMPSVSRVDNVYGDRNLICACPPMSAWIEGEEAMREAS